MRASKFVGRACNVIESASESPAFSSAARRSGQASTSGAQALHHLPQQTYRSASSGAHGCTDRRHSAPWRLKGIADEIRRQQCRNTDVFPGRAVSTLACQPSTRAGSSTAGFSLSAALPRQAARSHDHEQRRSAFGLPNLNGDVSKHYQERRLIGYSQDQLYEVVANVADYREFVPWCQRSEVIQSRPPTFVEAELEVGFKMFVERYTSQVHLSPPGKVVSHVYDSTLFDHLDSTWEFKPGPLPSTTWLSFSVDFAFKSPLYHHIASIFFDEVVKQMMGAFERRCQHMYGKSAFSKRAPAKEKLQTA